MRRLIMLLSLATALIFSGVFVANLALAGQSSNAQGKGAEKRSKKGRTFYGCQQYPKCKFAVWDKPVAEQCPACGCSIMVIKGSSEKGNRLECPKCKGQVEK